MRCGRRWWLVLLLLLGLSSVFSQAPEYEGPELPEDWLPIHETELTELDDRFLELETQATLLLRQLSEALTQSSEALRQQKISATLLEAAEISLRESEAGVTRLIRQRNTVMVIGSAAVIGLTALLVFR